jgi:hypothetical protein
MLSMTLLCSSQVVSVLWTVIPSSWSLIRLAMQKILYWEAEEDRDPSATKTLESLFLLSGQNWKTFRPVISLFIQSKYTFRVVN